MVSNLCNFIHQMPSRCDKILTQTIFKIFAADSSPMLIKIIFTAHNITPANVHFSKLIIMLPFQNWHCLPIKKQTAVHSTSKKKKTSKITKKNTLLFPSCRQCLITRAVNLSWSILDTSKDAEGEEEGVYNSLSELLIVIGTGETVSCCFGF